MSCEFLEGKRVSESICSKLEFSRKPILLILVTKEDPVIEKFVSAKAKMAHSLGVEVRIWRDYQSTQKELEQELLKNQFNADGVIIQLPLRDNLDKQRLFSLIDLQKDVDMLNPNSKQNFYEGKADIAPPVACAVDEILKFYKIPTTNKKILVAGYGELVGKPVYFMFKNQGKEVSSIDASTPQEKLTQELLQADMIVSGVGAPEFIKPENIKDGAVLIDAGTSSSKLTIKGDIDLSCCQKASYFAKTPGGVGPVTVACIFKNLSKLLK